MKFTPATIKRGAGVNLLHDTLIIDPTIMEWEFNMKHQRRTAELVKRNGEFLAKLSTHARERIANGIWLMVYEVLKQVLFRHVRELSEWPSWLSDLPFRYAKALKLAYYWHDAFDAPWIMPHLPFSGAGYLVDDSGLIGDAFHTFGLHRLNSVRQLAFLHDPLTEEPDTTIRCVNYSLLFDHSRWAHSLDVAAIANLILANNPGLKIHENVIRTAAISHDGRTPAGGDATKLVSRGDFCEETHFHELLDRPLWPAFSERWGVGRQELIDVVQGRGIAGRVLDLADKCAYLGRDLYMYLGRGNSTVLSTTSEFLPLQILARDNPNLCALWACAKVIGGQLVITDHEALYRFLKLRALLFKGLYYNPQSRMLEYAVGRKLLSWVYRSGRISREILLSWTDDQLSRYLNWLTGVSITHIYIRGSESSFGSIEKFKTVEEARRREDEHRDDLSTLAIVDEFTSQTKDGTESFFVRKGRRTVTFREAYPLWAHEIEETIKIDQTETRLYLLNMDAVGIHGYVRRELKEHRDDRPIKTCPVSIEKLLRGWSEGGSAQFNGMSGKQVLKMA